MAGFGGMKGRFALLALVLALAMPVRGQTLFDFAPVDIDENVYNLTQLAGRVTIVVNVATDWGYTQRDYTQLTSLQKQYEQAGLTVLGFPCDQFANQEPGTDAQIKAFAETFGILQAGGIWFHKIDVNGPNAIPLYQWVKKAAGVETISWNFAKFLVDRNGHVYQHYPPSTAPEDMESAIVQLLNNSTDVQRKF